MKIQLILLSIFCIGIFINCQSNTENSNQNQSMNKEPEIMEWLDLKGKKGAKNIVLVSGTLNLSAVLPLSIVDKDILKAFAIVSTIGLVISFISDEFSSSGNGISLSIIVRICIKDSSRFFGRFFTLNVMMSEKNK